MLKILTFLTFTLVCLGFFSQHVEAWPWGEASPCDKELEMISALTRRLEVLNGEFHELNIKLERSEAQRNFILAKVQLLERQNTALSEDVRARKILSFWTLTGLHGTKAHGAWKDFCIILGSAKKMVLGSRGSSRLSEMLTAVGGRINRDINRGKNNVSSSVLSLKGSVRKFLSTFTWGRRFAAQNHLMELVTAVLVFSLLFIFVLVPVLFLVSRIMTTSSTELDVQVRDKIKGMYANNPPQNDPKSTKPTATSGTGVSPAGPSLPSTDKLKKDVSGKQL